MVSEIKPNKWLRVPLVLVLAAVAFSTGCNGEPAVTPDYEMTALEFIDEFNQNHADFEDKYKNKTISIIGQILVIGGVGEVPILDVGTGPEDLYSVYAYFEEDSSALNGLEKGQFVRVVGTYSGQGFYTLELHHCSLLS